jgi:hypothetical protein
MQMFAKLFNKMFKKDGWKIFLLFIGGVLLFYLFYATTLNQVSTAQTSPPGVQTAVITILDLDGNGIKTTHYQSGRYFDHDSTGFAEQTGWVDPKDGILVWDQNNNGVIDDGKEVLGNFMKVNGKSAKGGLQLLKELDYNGDGRIDSKDEIFSKLRIWQDRNGNGNSEPDELSTLEELGVKAILLNYTDVNTTDENGNKLLRIAQYERTDGTRRQIGDCMVLRDTIYAINKEWLDVPEDIKELPDLKGYGNVHDLHQAMAKDKSGQLKQLLRMAMAESDPATRTVIFEQLLFKWAGVDHVIPTSRGPAVDARRLVLLEKFFGEEFKGINLTNIRNPNDNAAALLNHSYLGLFEMFYAQFMMQTHLKDIYSRLIFKWDPSGMAIKGKVNVVIPKLQALISQDEEKGIILLREFARTVKALKAEGRLGYDDLVKAFVEYGGDPACIGPKKRIIGDDKNNFILGSPGPDIIEGKGGDDYITGGLCDDELYGGEGNDKLYGDEGDDILDGGSGDDVLCGGPGNDTYVWGKGYGIDRIWEFDQSNNVLRFTKGTFESDLIFSLLENGKDLLIQMKNMRDSLRIQDWQKNNFFNIEKFIFADGKVLFPADILKIAQKGEVKLALYERRNITFYILVVLIGVLLACLIIIRIRRRKVR